MKNIKALIESNATAYEIFNESVSDKDLKSHLEKQEKWKGRDWFISYWIENIKGKRAIEVIVNGKRGITSDAEKMALKIGKPTLPEGLEYATGKPVWQNGTSASVSDIKKRDEMFDDRGYHDSEFSGEVYYILK
jgi:hypothetical protein